MQQGGIRLHHEEEREGGERGQQSRCNNLFCGFDTEFLSEALNVDRDTVRKLQNVNDQRGSIIRVRGRLEVVRPSRTEEEYGERERRRESDGAMKVNGLEETFCSMRIKENLGNPEHADIYNPNAGRFSTLNSHNLPILRWLRLSAERGVLYNNAAVIPYWVMNAHKILYMVRGQCRIQVVNERGEQVFDGTVQRWQLLTIPMNYAVVKRAEREGAEWISFNTNDNAMTTTLAGRTSALRAMREQVVAESYGISREEAGMVKYGNQETSFSSGSSRWERKSDA